MPIVLSPNFSPAADGVYAYQQTPNQAPLPDIDTALGAIVGTRSWGKPNTPLYATNDAEMYDAIGRMTSDAHACATEGYGAFDRGRNLVFIPVTDGTDTAAQIVLADVTTPTPLTIVAITANSSGSRANTASAALSASALSTATQPTYRLTLQMPDGTPETWDGIIGWKLVAGVATPDTPTLANNIAAAINIGTASRPPSAYWVATPGAATGAPALGLFGPTVLGTDGASGVTETMLIGIDGIGSARTGMFALRGTGFDTAILAGCYSAAVASAIASFAVSELGEALALIGPSGTSTNAGIATRQGNNLAGIDLGLAIDWAYINDPNTGLQRLVSPLGFMLGEITSTPPEQSPGNKPENGFGTRLLATERTKGQPLSGVGSGGGEIGQRATAGLLYITNQNQGANGRFKMAHGQNSSGISGQDGINYPRFSKYLLKGIFGIVGPYVDGLQSAAANDPLRSTVADAINAWLGTLLSAKRIAGFYVDPAARNTQATVAAGLAYLLIQVQYLGVARFFIPTLQGGVTVVLAGNSQSSVLAAAA